MHAVKHFVFDYLTNILYAFLGSVTLETQNDAPSIPIYRLFWPFLDTQLLLYILT